ncbi:MAG TPA: ChaN family lipoprotein, partial [Dissulfurispiraceae bacterium]
MILQRLSFLIMVLCLVCPALAAQGPQAAPGTYDLEVSFDIPHSKVIGTVKADIQAGREVVFAAGDLNVTEVSINGKAVNFNVIKGTLKLLPSLSGSIAVKYEGVFKGATNPNDTNFGIVGNVIDGRGISLTDIWYPQPEGLRVYKLRAVLPGGYTAISEAEEIRKTAGKGGTEYTFEFPHPVGGISFIATNKYDEVKDRLGDIDIYAYFLRDDRELAKTYLDYTKKYLKLYEDLLGRYPYRRFSVVENFLPTGYSMPTFTLLGQEVVRLPFIVETSLGHEILHQWFGNSVYVDYGKGNWSEGLTTYLADHYYEEQKGRGWEYRKQILVDYASYVNEKNEFPLKDFRSRLDSASRAIGYGKAAMVFHMLRRKVGDDLFFSSLRDFINVERFRRASWDDIRKAFDRATGKDLGKFFTQWVDEAGLPAVGFGAYTMKQDGDKFNIGFNVEQKEKVYALDVPVTVHYAGDRKDKNSFAADQAESGVKITLKEMPEKTVMDEDYDVARRLTREELPPVLARLLGDEHILIALPVSKKEIYKDVIETFKAKGAAAKEPAQIGHDDIKSSALVILGSDNPVIAKLYGTPPIPPLARGGEGGVGFSVIIKENPWNFRKVAGIFDAVSKEELDAAFRKIFHYGKYSVLLFDKGKNIRKEIAGTQRGIKMEQREQPTVVETSSVKTLPDIIGNVSGKKIVYIGEFHDRFAHHDVQLQVIKELYRKNKRLAIGMEMFERPHQKDLDDYILAGKIDEREFLKRSEYFKNWGFDYNLYKPILDFARAENIPVIALNIRKEIVEKVGKSGMDSLSAEEKKEVPQHMDYSASDYRERLREIFEKHNNSKSRNFDFFFQSQILWDESMSQSIDDFFRRNPDYQKDGQLAVVVGSGHLAYGVGIPERTFRRN